MVSGRTSTRTPAQLGTTGSTDSRRSRDVAGPARPISGAAAGFDADVTHATKETAMSEEAKAARQALQESMDLRDEGHTED